MKYNLKTYWWSDPCVRYVYNFGDLITPLLLQHYSKDINIIPTQRDKAAIYGVGSIIPAISPERFSVLLGCGSLAEKRVELPNALVYALRGELSKKMLNINEQITLGDPGLLIPYVLPAKDMINNNLSKPIGIIPHFKQYANQRIDSFRNHPNYKIINVRAEAECVIRDICSCSSIISSSLHGLIIADAYKIPNIRLVFEDNLFDVNDFKFLDYFSAIKRCGKSATSITPEQITSKIEYNNEYFANIDSVQKALDTTFKKFVSDLPLIQLIVSIDDLIRKADFYRAKNALNLTRIVTIAKKSTNYSDTIRKIVRDSDLGASLKKRLWYYRIMSKITNETKRAHYKKHKGILKQLIRSLNAF